MLLSFLTETRNWECGVSKPKAQTVLDAQVSLDGVGKATGMERWFENQDLPASFFKSLIATVGKLLLTLAIKTIKKKLHAVFYLLK